eukprot:scaffold39841_cov21-Tisochrysis_lutea.AAC.3
MGCHAHQAAFLASPWLWGGQAYSKAGASKKDDAAAGLQEEGAASITGSIARQGNGSSTSSSSSSPTKKQKTRAECVRSHADMGTQGLRASPTISHFKRSLKFAHHD